MTPLAQFLLIVLSHSMFSQHKQTSSSITSTAATATAIRDTLACIVPNYYFHYCCYCCCYFLESKMILEMV